MLIRYEYRHLYQLQLISKRLRDTDTVTVITVGITLNPQRSEKMCVDRVIRDLSYDSKV